MPWISIIIWLVTYLLSSKQEGVSKGEAALMATAAGVGSYYLFDPANPDNLVGWDGTIGGGTAGAGDGGGLGSLPGWLVPAAGGAIGGAVLSDSVPRWVWIAGAGLLAFAILK